MVSTIALLSIFFLTLLGTVLYWRASRRLSTVGNLKDVTVSRQWLQQHQADERS